MTSTLGPQREFDPAELAAILRWYADMGVDLAIEGEPRDRFADCAAERAAAPARPTPMSEGARQAPSMPRLAQGPARVADPAAALSQEAAAKSAREAAQAATSLEELRAALDAFEGCALKRTASRTVFADGDPASRIMLIGEAPGAEEDREGLPFAGRTGQILNRMLAAIGLERSGVYIANTVPWRPPGNRAPSQQETAICLPFITRQIELVNPQVIVCLGAASAQTLLNVNGILRARGQWRDYMLPSGATIPAMPTLHPAYVMRSPASKRLVWADLRQIRRALDAAN
jgi:DNA polymerase